jgi:hypothetical protein
VVVRGAEDEFSLYSVYFQSFTTMVFLLGDRILFSQPDYFKRAGYQTSGDAYSCLRHPMNKVPSGSNLLKYTVQQSDERDMLT